MDKQKKKQLSFLVIYFIISLFIVWLTKPLYIVSIFLVLGVPSLINFFWLKNSKWPILLFSILTGLLFAPPVELMARLLNVWDVDSIFYRPFGLIPIENMVFAFLNFFWVLSFYKHFIDKKVEVKINKRFKYLISLYLLFDILIFSLYYLDSSLVGADYFTIAIITLLVPGVLLFIKNKKIFYKTVIPTLFFSFIFFFYEIISLKVGSWFWPGEYFINLNIFGEKMPLDDIIIWYFMSTPVLIAGYEFFVDDNK